MTKILYIRKDGLRYSTICHGYCNECIIRFRCYTTKDKGLEITEKESLSCKEHECGVILL